MILVDTSIWVDHFRRGEPVLAKLLSAGQVLCHPFVIGELALGNLDRREETISALRSLPQSEPLRIGAFLSAIVEERLVAAGIGCVDVNLLLSVRRDPRARLWTRDKKLSAHAVAMDIMWIPAGE